MQFLNENISTAINISLKFTPKCQINNIPAIVPIMAWRRRYLIKHGNDRWEKYWPTTVGPRIEIFADMKVLQQDEVVQLTFERAMV